MGKTKQHFYDKDYVPKNLEDLYNSGWKEYMLFHIRRYHLYDVNNSPEDLLQDMMVQMATTGFLEKYDSDISEFTPYLHTFIKNFMSKPYNKEHKTLYGERIVNHMSFSSGSEDDEADANTVSYDHVSSGANFTDYVCLVNSMEKDLKAIKTESKVEYNGAILYRDPYTVYKMLLGGYAIKEIADIFGTSQQFVYSLRKKILDLKESYA